MHSERKKGGGGGSSTNKQINKQPGITYNFPVCVCTDDFITQCVCEKWVTMAQSFLNSINITCPQVAINANRPQFINCRGAVSLFYMHVDDTRRQFHVPVTHNTGHSSPALYLFAYWLATSWCVPIEPTESVRPSDQLPLTGRDCWGE